jgi:RNA polymerase sigma factor (sigma-70 family)
MNIAAEAELILAKPKDRKRDEALTSAVQAHGGQVLSVIRRKLQDEVEAEDVFQEVLEEFMTSYDVGLVVESVGAWLVRVAQNKVIDRFRRRKTESTYRAAKESEPVETSGDEWTSQWLREEMADALDLLPEEQRTVFVKHELEGKSFEEIAAETGTNINTLLARKRYAVLFLREHLKEIYDELEQ